MSTGTAQPAPRGSGPSGGSAVLPGCTNFRGLGGMPAAGGGELRGGMLYRSDGLARLSAEGTAAFTELGIATVVDLRTPEEVDRQPWAPPAGWPGTLLHLPLVAQQPQWEAVGSDPGHAPPSRDPVVELYVTALTGAGEPVRRVIELLADPAAYPVLVHCTSGRDRTAVVVAMVLRLIGISSDAIADDYALSPPAEREHPRDALRDDAAPIALLRAERPTMLAFLAAVDDRLGSFHRFVRACGVDDRTVAAMRQILLGRGRYPRA